MRRHMKIVRPIRVRPVIVLRSSTRGIKQNQYYGDPATPDITYAIDVSGCRQRARWPVIDAEAAASEPPLPASAVRVNAMT